MTKVSKEILVIVSGILTVVGMFAGLMTGFVSAATFDLYKETQQQWMGRIERKLDKLLEKEGIEYVEPKSVLQKPTESE